MHDIQIWCLLNYRLYIRRDVVVIFKLIGQFKHSQRETTHSLYRIRACIVLFTYLICIYRCIMIYMSILVFIFIYLSTAADWIKKENTLAPQWHLEMWLQYKLLYHTDYLRKKCRYIYDTLNRFYPIVKI